MYICQKCQAIVPKGVKCCKVVVETRRKSYPFRRKAHPGYFVQNDQMHRSSKFSDRYDDSGGSGLEIAKELLMCQDCAKMWLESHP
jgi:hypothetical protein